MSADTHAPAGDAAAQPRRRFHEKATGFPNDALVSYIQAAQARGGCPAQAG